MFFASLFIEIIELNFCGLSYMTKKNIELRARLDSNINNNDEESNSSEINYEDYLIKLENKTKIELELIENKSSIEEE